MEQVTFTKHADVRMGQRGFSSEMVDLILIFGSPERMSDGLSEYRLTRQKVRNMLQVLDKAKKKRVLINESSGAVVTVYNNR